MRSWHDITNLHRLFAAGAKAKKIVGSKNGLQVVKAGEETTNGRGRDFVGKWRASRNKTANRYVLEISI